MGGKNLKTIKAAPKEEDDDDDIKVMIVVSYKLYKIFKTLLGKCNNQILIVFRQIK